MKYNKLKKEGFEITQPGPGARLLMVVQTPKIRDAFFEPGVIICQESSRPTRFIRRFRKRLMPG